MICVADAASLRRAFGNSGLFSSCMLTSSMLVIASSSILATSVRESVFGSRLFTLWFGGRFFVARLFLSVADDRVPVERVERFSSSIAREILNLFDSYRVFQRRDATHRRQTRSVTTQVYFQ